MVIGISPGGLYSNLIRGKKLKMRSGNSKECPSAKRRATFQSNSSNASARFFLRRASYQLPLGILSTDSSLDRSTTLSKRDHWSLGRGYFLSTKFSLSSGSHSFIGEKRRCLMWKQNEIAINCRGAPTIIFTIFLITGSRLDPLCNVTFVGFETHFETILLIPASS